MNFDYIKFFKNCFISCQIGFFIFVIPLFAVVMGINNGIDSHAYDVGIYKCFLNIDDYNMILLAEYNARLFPVIILYSAFAKFSFFLLGIVMLAGGISFYLNYFTYVSDSDNTLSDSDKRNLFSRMLSIYVLCIGLSSGVIYYLQGETEISLNFIDSRLDLHRSLYDESLVESRDDVLNVCLFQKNIEIIEGVSYYE